MLCRMSDPSFHSSVNLNSFPDFEQSVVQLEQYSTPPFLLEKYAALIIEQFAHHSESIITKDKKILDLGCGTGRLSFTALLAGANQVIGFDIDLQAIRIARQYAIKNKIPSISWIHTAIEFCSLQGFRGKIAGVIMNPPFGTRRQYIDFVFLKRAFITGGWIISLHKQHPQTVHSLKQLVSKNHYELRSMEQVKFPLNSSRPEHRIKSYPVNVMLCFMTPLPK